MSGKIRIGTSGWNYDHWKGAFYPESLPQDEWLNYYTQHFETVEINNTFYQQPDDETFDNWRKIVPGGFQFAVKANRYITHLKRLKNPEETLEEFLLGTQRLQKHRGPLLYQLPPHWHPEFKRLEHFLASLPEEQTHVIEFRNREWLCDTTYQLLKRYNVSLCVHDLLKRHPRRLTGPILYLRLHGSGKKYGGRYRKRRLEAWAKWIREVARQRDVHAYFNNDEDAHAIQDAQRLRDILS